MEVLIVATLGLIVGSFLNVCIVRMPQNLSIAWPGSHCMACNKPIKWFDNIPVLSFLLLGGKCRQCKSPYAIRYMFVEIAGGAAFVLAYMTWDASAYTIMGAVIFWALIVMSVIDFEYQIIPDEISLGGLVVGLLFSIFFHDWHHQSVWWWSLISSLSGAIISGGFLLLLAIVAEKIFKKEAMGGGDVKFLAAVGAFIGVQGALLTLFIGSLVGSVGGILVKSLTKEGRIAFGPYLAIGFVISLVWGDTLISWYLQSVLQY